MLPSLFSDYNNILLPLLAAVDHTSLILVPSRVTSGKLFLQLFLLGQVLLLLSHLLHELVPVLCRAPLLCVVSTNQLPNEGVVFVIKFDPILKLPVLKSSQALDIVYKTLIVEFTSDIRSRPVSTCNIK